MPSGPDTEAHAMATATKAALPTSPASLERFVLQFHEPTHEARHGIDTPMTSERRDPLVVEELERRLQESNQKMINYMLEHPIGTPMQLWSNGYIQVAGRHIRLRAEDAPVLYRVLKEDKRFINEDVVHLTTSGEEGLNEWEATYIRQ